MQRTLVKIIQELSIKRCSTLLIWALDTTIKSGMDASPPTVSYKPHEAHEQLFKPN